MRIEQAWNGLCLAAAANYDDEIKFNHTFLPTKTN
jgi:hypothetical protein